jgi:hypothetical protein
MQRWQASETLASPETLARPRLETPRLASPLTEMDSA